MSLSGSEEPPEKGVDCSVLMYDLSCELKKGVKNARNTIPRSFLNSGAPGVKTIKNALKKLMGESIGGRFGMRCPNH